MPINTLDLRTAAIKTGTLRFGLGLPIPDGLIGAGDRMELCHTYRNADDLGDPEALIDPVGSAFPMTFIWHEIHLHGD